MHKLMVLFHRPSSIEGFESAWSGTFVPAAEQMPGIRRIAVSRPLESISGSSDFYLLHEFFFDSLASARQAMASAAGQTAGRVLMSFAADRVTLYFAEHLEEDRSEG